ncbi:MAG: adenylyltransferase/cytidyltransferase family protein [Candidatus Liptonbacteria bacterium]
MNVRDKIKPLGEISRIIREAQKRGLKVVTTNGCFDLLHAGHARNLVHAKSFGDMLVVGVNSDKSVRFNKGRYRPIIGEKERAEMLAALEAVDYVFLFSEKHVGKLIEKLKPDIHAKGKDYKASEIMDPVARKKLGIKIALIPISKGKSTTGLIHRICELERKRTKKEN